MICKGLPKAPGVKIIKTVNEVDFSPIIIPLAMQSKHSACKQC